MNKYLKFTLSYGLNIIAFIIMMYLVIAQPANSFYFIIYALLCLLGSFLAIHYSYDSYFQSILIQFSDLIQSIISLQQQEIFIEDKDTLLSKIQTQFERLISILKYQNQKLSLEREEIASIVANISHQLKTPIASLKLYSELLKDEKTTDDKRKQCIEAIYTLSQQLDFLTAQLIKLARLEANIIQIQPQMQDIQPLLIDIIGNLYIKASDKNIQILYENGMSQQCYFDWNWTYEAIYNVLDNAIKYSKEAAEIRIEIRTYEMYLCIEVWDEAKLIPESEYPNIFKRFYRGKNVLKTEGIGLGMFLTQKILESEDGYIQIAHHQKGNKFMIYLKR